jgi:uncharacterized protein YjbI with pentapeptide repeats
MKRYQVTGMVGIIFLLLITAAFLMTSSARAHETTPLHVPATGTVSVQTTPTIQATPPVDATMTTLEKERLEQQIDQSQQDLNNWFWNSLNPLASTILPTIGVILTVVYGFRRWLGEQSIDRVKRDEDRLQSAIQDLGTSEPGKTIGGAVMLRTFLLPGYEKYGYEKYHIQIFDLAVANLRLPRKSASGNNSDNFGPPEPVNQALAVLFKDAFPAARRYCVIEELKKQPGAKQESDISKEVSRFLESGHAKQLSPQELALFNPLLLDATGVQLDQTYLNSADLEMAYLRSASLKGTNLEGAKLKGADLEDADLEGANLRKASFDVANLIKAKSLTKVNLSGQNLEGEDFTNYKRLHQIQLENASLRNAQFTKCDLTGANLKKADLEGTKFDRANLTGADFTGVRNYEKATWDGAIIKDFIGLLPDQQEELKAKGAYVTPSTS